MPVSESFFEPFGVWVIQMSYGGSPAADQAGMPMK